MTSARHADRRKSVPVSRVQCRFVYADGVKGEWVPLAAAMATWLQPAPDRVVDRVEFNELERPK